MAYDFKYKPAGETLRQFMLDDHFFRGVRGPVGSGKSVACCVEIFRRAAMQKPGKDGKRKSRWAVVRNTNPQLKTTTIKTWIDWFPEDVFGRFGWSVPYNHNISIGDVELEVLFLALDREEDVRKLLSLDLTGVWVNEAREVSKSIIDACTMRVGRFPSIKDGGPSWYGVICDTNAPEDDHWWPIMAGEAPMPDNVPREEALMLVKPEDWVFYNQPPGMLEIKNDSGEVEKYIGNQMAENFNNLPADYYKKIITGKTKSWIDVYVLNKLGTIESGKAIYPMFSEQVHIAKEKLHPIPNLPVYIGIDFGLTPAAAFGQRLPSGRWQIFHEIVTRDMGAVRFSELLRNQIQVICPDNELHIYGDPAGDFRAQTDEVTPFQILRANGIKAYPAPSNDPVLRIESVQAPLNRMVDGFPGFQIDSSCATLIKGFRGGYNYRRVSVSGEVRYEEKPTKNKYSHVHDALQYLFIGAGEGRSLTTNANKPAQVANGRSNWNIWDQRSGFGKNKGWSNLSRRNSTGW
jgi:hypothetical protein